MISPAYGWSARGVKQPRRHQPESERAGSPQGEALCTLRRRVPPRSDPRRAPPPPRPGLVRGRQARDLRALDAWRRCRPGRPTPGTLPELLREPLRRAVALSPYAEWYSNALRIPGSPDGPPPRGDLRRRALRALPRALRGRCSRAGTRSPWAELFAAAGARYVVLVTKHHDGYCLWPTRHAEPAPARLARRARRGRRPGPRGARPRPALRRLLLRRARLDLRAARRSATSRDDLAAVPLRARLRARYVDAHYRELIDRYQPERAVERHRLPAAAARLWRLLADYYAAVARGRGQRPLRPGAPGLGRLRALAARPGGRRRRRRAAPPRAPPGYQFVPPPPAPLRLPHPEYARLRRSRAAASGRPPAASATPSGTTTNEPEANLIDPDELVRSFVDIVAKNGNLLLNVGPTRDGVIPPASASGSRRWAPGWRAPARRSTAPAPGSAPRAPPPAACRCASPREARRCTRSCSPHRRVPRSACATSPHPLRGSSSWTTARCRRAGREATWSSPGPTISRTTQPTPWRVDRTDSRRTCNTPRGDRPAIETSASSAAAPSPSTILPPAWWTRSRSC